MKNVLIMLLLSVSFTAFGNPIIKESNAFDIFLPDSTNPTSDIITQPQSQSITIGASATFKVVVPQGAFLNQYQWKLNGVNIPGATDSVYKISVTTNADLGTYSVAVTEFMGEFTGSITISEGAVLSVGNSSTKFTFIVKDTSSLTSAGVYDQNDNLIRTLWSGIRYPVGSFDTTWDGKDDQGVLVPDANYIVKVTANNISAAYLGVIGNNSDSTHGSTVWRQEPVSSITFPNSNTGYVTIRNTEGSFPMFKFDVNHIHQKTGLLAFANYQTNFTSCTDGNLVYIYSTSPNATIDNAYTYYIHAVDPSTDQEYAFANGVDVGSGGVPVHSALDSTVLLNAAYASGDDAARVNSCLAVQRNGRFLFSGHYQYISILDKTTGARIATSTVTGATRMVCDYDGNLWVVANGIRKYQVDDNGTLTLMFEVTGNGYPMAMDVSPDNNTLITLDGSTQQVKAYSIANGSALWKLGQLNGYYVNAIAANDKFYFKDDRYNYTVSVAYQPDGTFWVGDAGNNRLMHFDADRNYIDFIMHQPATYQASVDPGNKTHAFMGYCRFDMDYSDPAHIKWALARNYGARRPFTNVGVNQDYDRPISYFTLSNGRTYTAIGEHSHEYQAQFEVTDTGFRKTGTVLYAGAAQMDSIGNILQYSYNGSGAWILYQQSLLGFDGQNNPIYGANFAAEQVANINSKDPVSNPSLYLNGRLSDNTLVIYDGFHDANYHLGFLKHGASTYGKRTMAPTSPGYSGNFPSTGYFDIGNTVGNAGGPGIVNHDIIYAGYHGEFWKQGQTNKWNMFDKNALFLYQFGKVKQDGTEEAAYGMAGNTLYANVINVGSHTYLFHQDESYHGGLLYWGIYNTEKVVTNTYPIVKNGTPTITFPYMRLNDGLKWATTLEMNDSSGWIRNTAENISTMEWVVNSGLKSYDKNLPPDITAIYGYVYSNDSAITVTKALGTVANSNWSLDGSVNLIDNAPNGFGSYAVGYIQILDDNGKIIARIAENGNGSIPNQNGVDIITNDKVLATYTRPYGGAPFAGLADWISFSAKAVGTTLTFTFGNNTTTTTTLVDPTANISRAATFMMYFAGKTYSLEKKISLKDLHFKRF